MFIFRHLIWFKDCIKTNNLFKSKVYDVTNFVKYRAMSRHKYSDESK